MNTIQTIVVVGGGMMGQRIAELTASKGFDTILIERTDNLATQAKKKIDELLEQKLMKWGITEAEKKSTLNKLRVTDDHALLSEADFVIESVHENLEHKRDVFLLCDKYCENDVIFATNSSTLSLTEIASFTNRPDKVIGLHFVYPVPTQPLVELVRGLKTSQATVNTVLELLPRLCTEGVEVYESPGFITTRLISLLINEAMCILMEGVATPKAIDIAMKKGYQFQAGPLEIADRLGLDKVLTSLEQLFREFGDPRFRPASILKKMVRAGNLGVKTGEGFFKYTSTGTRIDE